MILSKQVFDIWKAAADAAIPQGGITVSDWADDNRVLSAEASAEPGKWRTSRVPYARRWMDVFTDPYVPKVVLKTSSQVAKSETLNNVCGYFIHHDPCPILFIQPTVDRMKDYSKKRIAPMLRDTPALALVVADESSRDSDNTVLSKSFVGGHLLMTGANAASALASNPIRVVLADEIDRYPRDVDNEGDPLSLAEARQITFTNRKTGITSTPTIKGASRIEEEYAAGSMEQYHVPCPHCGHMQTLRFRDKIELDNGDTELGDYRLMWETSPDDPEKVISCIYVCEKGCVIEEHNKLSMLDDGEWIAQQPDKDIKSFEINALYSVWLKWTEIAEKFIKATKAAKAGKPELLIVFTNTILGESWNTDQEGSDIKGLENRAEEYNAEIPLGVLCLTAGVDVQPDRLECEVVGWGLEEESWSINYFVILGNTNGDDVWQQLEEILARNFECEREDATGTRLQRSIDAMCIDTAGHNTQRAYNFCKAKAGRRVLGVKSLSSGEKEAISKRPTKLKGGMMLYLVGSSIIKGDLFGKFGIKEVGPGYCHFPVGYDSEYYKQLGAEKRVKKIKKFDKNDPHGYDQWMFKKIRSRNEALDCRMLSTAALRHLNPNFPSLLEQENLHCAPKSDTLYNSENEVAGNNFRSRQGRFGSTKGFVSSWNRRS
jgi:phage terminase large subunit GpA-like protein